MAIDERAIARLTVKVAETAEEIAQAAELVQAAYVDRGITEAHPSGVRVTPHLLLPSTALFVAKAERVVVGTVALVLDSKLRLPMDQTYGAEIAALRAQGRTLAEVGALSISPEHRRTGAVFLLNKIMWRCATEIFGVDDLVVAVHPDVEDLYRAGLHFERIGEARRYAGLNANARAVALRLNLRTARSEFFRRHGREPKNATNPHYLYCERVDPQIRMPRGAPSLERRLDARVAASSRLASIRQDAFEALTREDRAYLTWMLMSPRSEHGCNTEKR